MQINRLDAVDLFVNHDSSAMNGHAHVKGVYML